MHCYTPWRVTPQKLIHFDQFKYREAAKRTPLRRVFDGKNGTKQDILLQINNKAKK